MPGRDRSGPMGRGPMTGRGMGPCGQAGAGARGAFGGMGFGSGRGGGWGGGWRHRNWYNATGVPGWGRSWWRPWEWFGAGAAQVPFASKEQELAALRGRAASLEQELGELGGRIRRLEQSEAGEPTSPGKQER